MSPYSCCPSILLSVHAMSDIVKLNIIKCIQSSLYSISIKVHVEMTVISTFGNHNNGTTYTCTTQRMRMIG